jgi:hypothetical protein
MAASRYILSLDTMWTSVPICLSAAGTLYTGFSIDDDALYDEFDFEEHTVNGIHIWWRSFNQHSATPTVLVGDEGFKDADEIRALGSSANSKCTIPTNHTLLWPDCSVCCADVWVMVRTSRQLDSNAKQGSTPVCVS